MAHEHRLPVELHLRDGEGNTHAHDVAQTILEQEGVPEAGCDLHFLLTAWKLWHPLWNWLLCRIWRSGNV